MDHQKHRMWCKITSVLSILIFFVGITSISFILHQSIYISGTLEIAIISAVFSFITACSCGFDVRLYLKSNRDIQSILQFVHFWQQVCKFKIISCFLIALIYTFLFMIFTHEIKATYAESVFGTFILSLCGLTQFAISSKLKFVYEDCIMRCVHGFNLDATRSSNSLNGNQITVLDDGGKLVDINDIENISVEKKL